VDCAFPQPHRFLSYENPLFTPSVPQCDPFSKKGGEVEAAKLRGQCSTSAPPGITVVDQESVFMVPFLAPLPPYVFYLGSRDLPKNF